MAIVCSWFQKLQVSNRPSGSSVDLFYEVSDFVLYEKFIYVFTAGLCPDMP